MLPKSDKEILRYFITFVEISLKREYPKPTCKAPSLSLKYKIDYLQIFNSEYDEEPGN